ncbi:MAG: patatin-like phospholipase family protein [Betaproteobacteria bacterium]
MVDESRSFTIHAGPRAAEHIAREGLRPADIACVPAAAGGPKGLGLIPLDQRLFGGWLDGASGVELIGASIGAWRMCAAAQTDAPAALARLAEAYVAQTYPPKPSAQRVSDECRLIARAALGAGIPTLRPEARLTVITARARGALDRRSGKRAFARAAFANLRGRAHLATHMERVVFATPAARFPKEPFDRFGLRRVPFSAANAEDALLASGSIPLVAAPVETPAGAPPGDYWDGGLIDYHLQLPYAQLSGLVLYPHFVPYVTPGWLDKHLPWRAHSRAHSWLANMVLIAPSRSLLERLPNRKLPDRQDFYRYGLDHERRQRDWKRAIAECERFADEVMAWLARPDPSRIAPL